MYNSTQVKVFILNLIAVWGMAINLHGQSMVKVWIHQDDQVELNEVVKQQVHYCSQWLPYCSYRIDSMQLQELMYAGLSFLPVNNYQLTQTTWLAETWGFALEQIEADAFKSRNLTGAGIKIGVIDGGFLKADKRESLSHLFSGNQIRGYRDLITPDLHEYDGMKWLDDEHGTDVLQLIGGLDAEKSVRYGLATQATYYLARTDHGGFEKRIEEDYLIQALEWMQEQGVRVVNISLGYNTGFTDKSENYLKEQMDGKTTITTLAVEHAVLEKGMVVVVAAGNDARGDWKIVAAPADAPHALSVGASKYEIWDKMDYSSIGPDFVPFVKPDIAVYASRGTSFAAPVITGLVACMMQFDSTLNNLQIMEIIKKAGHFYPYPNNYLGYGVPTCSRILKLMENEKIEQVKSIRVSKDHYVLPQRKEKRVVVVYHKTNETKIAFRYVLRSKKKKIKIDRPEGIHRSTLLMEKQALEVIWQ